MCKYNLGIRLNRDESRNSVNDNIHWMNKSTNYHLPSYHPMAPLPSKKGTFSSLLRKGESDDDRFLVCQQFWQTNNVSDEILILFHHRSDVMESLRLPSSCTVWGEPDLFCNLFKLSHWSLLYVFQNRTIFTYCSHGLKNSQKHLCWQTVTLCLYRVTHLLVDLRWVDPKVDPDY